MKQPKKRKRGGQPKPAAERKRNNVTIRLIDDLRAKLEAASRASGRSLSEEAAWRLTMSFLFNHEIQEVAQIQREFGRRHGGDADQAGLGSWVEMTSGALLPNCVPPMRRRSCRSSCHPSNSSCLRNEPSAFRRLINSILREAARTSILRTAQDRQMRRHRARAQRRRRCTRRGKP